MNTKYQSLFLACYNTTSKLRVSHRPQQCSVHILKVEDCNTASFFHHTAPLVDLENDADSQTANTGPAERPEVTRMGCCSLNWLLITHVVNRQSREGLSGWDFNSEAV